MGPRSIGTKPMLSDRVVWLTPWRSDEIIAAGSISLSRLPIRQNGEHMARTSSNDWWREWIDGTSMTLPEGTK